MLQQDQEHLRLLQTENINLRNLLCETRGRLRPLPLAMHPEDHEDDTLPARIDAALDDDTLPVQIDAKGAGDRVRDVLLSAVHTAQNGEQGRREHLGRVVREEWIKWAREQPNPKPSWLVPWEELSEPDKEVDRRIGVRLYSIGVLTSTTLTEKESAPIESAKIVLTDAELAEVETLDREATPGEWLAVDVTEEGGAIKYREPSAGLFRIARVQGWDRNRANLALIVRARTLLPRLAAALKAERARTAGHLRAIDVALDNAAAPIGPESGEGIYARDARVTALGEDLRLTADAPQREIERVTVLQEDLARARATNTQAEAVMRQNVEMLAAMERSSDPAMRQLATEIRRRT